jgi:hypothetical protein
MARRDKHNGTATNVITATLRMSAAIAVSFQLTRMSALLASSLCTNSAQRFVLIARRSKAIS